jgi:hypothetical protein
MKKLNFKFAIVEENIATAQYTEGCSGDRSDCCTRDGDDDDDAYMSLPAWDQYLAVNAGVIQY